MIKILAKVALHFSAVENLDRGLFETFTVGCFRVDIVKYKKSMRYHHYYYSLIYQCDASFATTSAVHDYQNSVQVEGRFDLLGNDDYNNEDPE